MTSCYKDKGNYDYTNIEDVTITFPSVNEDNIIEAESYKEFTVTADIETKLDKNNFSYEWIIDDNVVGDEEVLHFEKLPLLARSEAYLAKLTVKDSKTEFVYSNYFKISVNSVVGSGWLILSEYNGYTHLGHKSNADNKFTQSIFEMVNNGKKLELGAVEISSDEVAQTQNEYMHIMVKNGQAKGSVFNPTTFEEYYPMTGSFASTNIPSGAPESMSYSWHNPGMMIWGGNIYSSGNATPFPKFVTGKLNPDNTEFHTLFTAGEVGTSYLYEETTGSWASYKWSLNTNLMDYGSAQAFPVANSGYKKLAIGSYPIDFFDSEIVSLMVDPADNKIYELTMKTGWDNLLTETKREMPDSNLFDEATSKFVLVDNLYYYFTSGSKLYRRAHTTNDAPVLVHTFDSDIVYLARNTKAGVYSYIVATYDNSDALTGDIYFCTDKLTSFDIDETYLDVAGKVADMVMKK
jgi:hypothetical protein